MQKVDVVAPEFTMNRSPVTIEAPLAGAPTLPDLGGRGLVQSLRALVGRLTDAQLATWIAAILFAVSAWPLALTEVPPYQDLPNHYAAVTVIEHPELYPDFVSNGFLKTNAALFTWLCFAGKVFGVKLAGKLFAMMVLALNAVVFPRLVLALTGSRKKLVVASFFVWPMIHNWFVSMGMLDFAMGVPLSLIVLMLLHRQSRAPSWKTAALVVIAGLATWYAHVFCLMVVHLLAAVHVVTRRSWAERVAQAKAIALPLLPTTALTIGSLLTHFSEKPGEMTGFIAMQQMLPPWELIYNMFAEWMYGFTWLSITSLVVCLALGAIGLWRWREDVPFFSPVALIVLGVFFLCTPYIATNWFHVNSRFIPFLWMALLVRVPERLPRRAPIALAACAALYSLGMGVDFVRLDADRAQFTAGIPAVPHGAKLLPLIFRRGKLTSENTRSVLHAWGFYVVEKQTSAPLLFAHSRSFPVMYKEPPPIQFNHLVLEEFAPSMGSAAWACDVLRSGGVVVNDCEAQYDARWREFWAQALPRYDHVLMWDATPEALAHVPRDYRLSFSRDRLAIFERSAVVSAR